MPLLGIPEGLPKMPKGPLMRPDPTPVIDADDPSLDFPDGKAPSDVASRARGRDGGAARGNTNARARHAQIIRASCRLFWPDSEERRQHFEKHPLLFSKGYSISSSGAVQHGRSRIVHTTGHVSFPGVTGRTVLARARAPQELACEVLDV
jgi:hypothetical protein